MTKTIQKDSNSFLFFKRLAIFSLVFLLPFNTVLADLDEAVASSTPIIEEAPAIYQINTANIPANGQVFEGFNGGIKVTVDPDSLTGPVRLELKKITDNIPTPWQLTKIGQIYQFDFPEKNSLRPKAKIKVQIAYSDDVPGLKQLYFFDRNKKSWQLMENSLEDSQNQTVSAETGLSYAQIAIFADPQILMNGKASWYKYKNGLFAASPDFAKGSKVRVYNTDYAINKKYSPFVDVIINDYGPDRNKHPERVIDLDKVAFAKLVSTGAGTLNVRLELLSGKRIEGKVLGVSIKASDKPELSAKSAIVINEATGEVIFEKNSEEVLPIASLSKMVAIRTYLDLQPVVSLNYAIVYKYADEEHNYEFCPKSESARVTLRDGDVVTVKDLIYSALVGSANNAVETLARVSGVSRDIFIQKMNENSVKWGATETSFFEPTGLSKNNVSSAKDYAIIMKEVLKNKIIMDASTAPQYKFKTLNTKKAHTLNNSNRLVLNKPNFTITGSKTGYIDEAGYCLMTRATQAGNSLIAVVLGATTKNNIFSEVKDLLTYGLKQIALTPQLAKK
jgi:D-alanyl-D-alanine carboxypeptidase